MSGSAKFATRGRAVAGVAAVIVTAAIWVLLRGPEAKMAPRVVRAITSADVAALPPRASAASVLTRPTPAVAPTSRRETMAVVVLDEARQPVSGAMVIASERPVQALSSPDYAVLGLSDAAGRIVADLAQLPDTIRVVSAHHPAYVAASATRPWNGTPVELVMTRGLIVNFKCRAFGKPLPGVSIRLSGVGFGRRGPDGFPPLRGDLTDLGGSAGKNSIFGCVTDASGEAVLSGMPPGAFDVVAQVADHPWFVLATETAQFALVTLPTNETITLDFLEPFIYALDTKDNDTISFKAPSYSQASFRGAMLASQQAESLRQAWPGRIMVVMLPPQMDGVPPRDMLFSVLHPSGVSVTSVRPVRLSEFVAPQPEAPITANSAVGFGSVVVRFEADGGGSNTADFYDYLFLSTSRKFAPTDEWCPPVARRDGRYRLAEGEYRISPLPNARGAFVAKTFKVAAGEAVKLSIPLASPLRKVRLHVTDPATGSELAASVVCREGTQQLANVQNSLADRAWLPVGHQVTAALNAFGIPRREVVFSVQEGEGDQVESIGLRPGP